MCLGIPGELVAIMPEHQDLAMVSVSGVRRAVNIGLLREENLQPGDWILIHVGFGLSKIDQAEALASLQFLASMGQPYADELDGLSRSDIA